MSIIRVVKDEVRYVSIKNDVLRDKNLTWEARGVLGYLLSRPDNWQVSIADLVKQSEQGIRIVRRVLKELEMRAYLQRARVRQKDGTFRYESTVYESPHTQKPHTVEPSADEPPAVDVATKELPMFQEELIKQTPLPKEEIKDVRHSLFERTHKRLYMERNNCPPSEVPWGKKEGGHLKELLGRKSWTEALIVRCLENRFKSEVNHRQGPMKYMDDLTDYADGPLNAYGKPLARARVEAPLHHAGDL